MLTGGFPHKGPVRRKIFPFDDIIMAVLTHFSRNIPASASQGGYSSIVPENGLAPTWQQAVI